MIYKKQIENEISELVSLNDITKAYALISSIMIKRVRESVLKSRDFLDSIFDIFNEVFYSYKKEVMSLAIKGRGKKGITFLSHNGRTVCVFLSSNTRLYGDVVVDTFNNFLREIREKDVEATIIGRYGLILFRQVEKGRPYTYFDFPDNEIDTKQLMSIISHLVQYEEIHLYYPKFENVITQRPSVFKISAGSTITEARPKEFKYVSYIFEPSLEDILIFFETEIFTSVFEQTIRESQLAKFASRLVAMDIAQGRIKDKISEAKLRKSKLVHAVSNRKQLHSLLGISLWNMKI
jgi:F-type H+-transporting ATPase subunit gamma